MGDGAVVSEFTDGADGGVLQPEIPLQKFQKRHQRAAVADLAERLGRGMTHVAVGVGERRDQDLHRVAAPYVAQHHRAEVADLLVAVGKKPAQARHGLTAELDQHLHGAISQVGVVVVAHRRLQG